MSELRPPPHRQSAADAARSLGIDEATLRGLVAAGFLAVQEGDVFALTDLKAFLARNADNGTGNFVLDQASDADPQVLLDALDGRSEEMAKRAFEIFAGVFPEAREWSLTEHARFISQARNRFEAILAVTGQGAAVDEALVGDLQDVGAAAAWAGSPLPHLLAILRISRDLVVQTAVELAEERGRHWGLALSLVLTRVLPAMDRLTDALAQGYWAALVGREEELRDRYEQVVESSSDGVFEIDLDGTIQYANPSLAVMLARPVDQLIGQPLQQLLDRSVDELVAEQTTRLTVIRADGVRRVLDVKLSPRHRLDGLVGHQGVVDDLTAALDLEADRREFLTLVTHDLRSPLAAILAHGANLEAHAGELPSDQIARIGTAVRLQAERTSRLADDLHDVTKLAASELAVNVRAVDLAGVVHAALASVPSSDSVEVRIPKGVDVLADARRLEQVVANLVENGLSHGAPPVVVSLELSADERVTVSISDHGAGVNPALVPSLFSGLRTLTREDRDASRGSGLGLALVRGLVNAMGGSVEYEPADEGARFVVNLQRPRT